jgi:hypothetical protein
MFDVSDLILGSSYVILYKYCVMVFYQSAIILSL